MTLPRPSDPLLAVARFCTTALLVLFAVIIAALLISAAALFIIPGAFPGYLASGEVQIQLSDMAQGMTPAMLTPGFLAVVGLALLLMAAMVGAGFQFVRLLRRIIDSVGAGDPFTPANAARLAQMAWLLVATELATLPLHGLGAWITQHGHAADVTVDIDISVSNLFVALVLFILARVFREGTRLRDELEGTV